MVKSTSMQGIRNRIRQLSLFESLSRNLKERNAMVVGNYNRIFKTKCWLYFISWL